MTSSLASHPSVRRLFVTLARFALVLAIWVFVGGARAASDAPDGSFDRSTPRRAISAFLLTAEAGDYRTAATMLDLRSLPADVRNAFISAHAAMQADVNRLIAYMGQECGNRTG